MKRFWISLLLLVLLILAIEFCAISAAQAAPCGQGGSCVTIITVPAPIYLPLVMR